MSLSFYTVNEEYNSKLHRLDSRVMSLKGEKSKRPFVGILIKVDGFNYLAPLSSPKTKHLNMKNQIDFYKIDYGKLGVINLNNMIPVNERFLVKINPSQIQQNNISDTNYVNLLNKQLSWLNQSQNEQAILKKAEKLRSNYLNGNLPQDRCVNFELLEKQGIC